MKVEYLKSEQENYYELRLELDYSSRADTSEECIISANSDGLNIFIGLWKTKGIITFYLA